MVMCNRIKYEARGMSSEAVGVELSGCLNA